MPIEENTPLLVNEASFLCLQKEKLCQYGRRVKPLEKWKEQLATWFQDEISWFWQLIQQIWPLQDTANKKVLSFWGLSALSAENFAPLFWYDWLSFSITDSEKLKKRLSLFLLGLGSKDTLITLFDSLPPSDLVRNGRNQRFTFYVNGGFPSKSQLKKVLKCWCNILFEAVFAFYNGPPERA